MTRYDMEETKTRIIEMLSSSSHKLSISETRNSLHQLLSAMDMLHEKENFERDHQAQLLQRMNSTCANLTVELITTMMFLLTCF